MNEYRIEAGADPEESRSKPGEVLEQLWRISGDYCN